VCRWGQIPSTGRLGFDIALRIPTFPAMHIGPAPQLMDFFDHPGTTPRHRGELFAWLFFVGVGWLAMDTGLRRYDDVGVVRCRYDGVLGDNYVL